MRLADTVIVNVLAPVFTFEMCLKNVGNVPGSGPCTKGFNNGTLTPVRIFKGPYACEEDAELDFHTGLTSLSACSRACLARSNCNFYMFRATDETCTLYEACDYMQQVNLKISNELYGIPPRNVSYCRIADPGTCWQDIKRRSYLSLIESDLPKCLFQEQHVACDSLQLVSGELAGACAECQYIDANSSYALKGTGNGGYMLGPRGMRKEPLPEEFPAASQIVVSCNDTSRMFAQLQEGLVWNGPRQTTIFSCVSGNWVGDTAHEGAWQSLENLKCEDCLQLGSSSLQRLTNVSMPEVYFMQHRLIHVTHGFKTKTSCGFDSCFYAMDIVDTAAQLWNLSVADNDGKELQLEEWKGDEITGAIFDIQLAAYPGYCLVGDFTATVLPGRFPLRMSKECNGAWTVARVKGCGAVLQYWSGNASYYLSSGENDANYTTPDLVPLSHFPDGKITALCWDFEYVNLQQYNFTEDGQAFFFKNMWLHSPGNAEYMQAPILALPTGYTNWCMMPSQNDWNPCLCGEWPVGFPYPPGLGARGRIPISIATRCSHVLVNSPVVSITSIDVGSSTMQ
eukprot:Skav223476  [mRNA]  locus=scaffold659:112868:114883:- [translate_table: standard]